jgi:RNA polymerase subunit RPABC4/transcription elongation factor Spt4
MQLSRPQRRRLFAATFAVAWAIAAVVFLGPSGSGWTAGTAAGPAAASGTRTLRFGVLPYLTLRTEDVTVTGTPGPDARRAWSWNGRAAVLAALAMTMVTLLCLEGYRRAVNGNRLAGRCDECGYSLVGLRSGTCPECGASLFNAARVPRPPEGSGGATSVTARRAGPGRRPYVALLAAWAFAVAVLWLAGSRMTVTGAGMAERTVDRRGVPTWLVTETTAAPAGGGAGTRTHRLQPGGLAIVAALTVVWTGVVAWGWARVDRRRSCPHCGYRLPGADASCPVCGQPA